MKNNKMIKEKGGPIKAKKFDNFYYWSNLRTSKNIRHAFPLKEYDSYKYFE